LAGAQKGKLVVSRLAIAFVLALASIAANAQNTKPEQSQTPAVPSANGTRPFLFDGRMIGDGARQGTLPDDHHPDAGAIFEMTRWAKCHSADELFNARLS
jgi:hypothetical protein